MDIKKKIFNLIFGAAEAGFVKAEKEKGVTREWISDNDPDLYEEIITSGIDKAFANPNLKVVEEDDNSFFGMPREETLVLLDIDGETYVATLATRMFRNINSVSDWEEY